MFRKKGKRKTIKENEKKKHFSSLCAKHSEKELDLYCVACDEVYCRECKTNKSHAMCKPNEQKYISDIAYEFGASEEFRENDQNIFALRKKIERSIEKANENMKLSVQLQKEADFNISKQKESLFNRIEIHYRNLSEENKKRNEDCLATLGETLKEFDLLKTQFEDIESEMNEKKRSKITSLFIAIKKSKEDIEKIKDCIGTLDQSNYVTRYGFKAGEQARTYMKEIGDFGKLIEENLNSTETQTNYTFTTLEPLYSTFDYDRSNYFQRSRGSTYQRSYSPLERRFGRTPVGTTLPKSNMLRCQSELVLPILSETARIQVKRGNLEPEIAYSAISMASHEQFSDSSNESLNSSSVSSRDLPKHTPVRDPSSQDYLVPKLEQKFDSLEPPKLGPKPSALLIEQSAERQDRGFTWQTQLDLDRLEDQNEKPLLRRRSDTFIPTPDSQTELHEEQEMYKVLYPYKSDEETFLSCEEGDTVIVLTKCTGVYWRANLNGQVGFIRKDYLEEIIESGPDTSVNNNDGFSCEQTINNTGSEQSDMNYSPRYKPTVPPKPGPKPSTLAIKQAKDGQDHSFSRQTREKPVKYKALFPYTSRDKECLSIQKGDIVTVLEKCPGDFFMAELKGQCGFVPKDHLKELSELEIKFLYRKSVSYDGM